MSVLRLTASVMASSHVAALASILAPRKMPHPPVSKYRHEASFPKRSLAASSAHRRKECVEGGTPGGAVLLIPRPLRNACRRPCAQRRSERWLRS